MIAGPISGALGLPIQQVQGHHRRSSRARTRCATRSARRPPPPRSMIGVALVGLITIFAAHRRARRWTRRIDRSMKADYVVQLGRASARARIPIEAEQRARRRCRVSSRCRVCAAGAGEDRRLGRPSSYAADPQKIDSLFDLRPSSGQRSPISAPTGSRSCSDRRATTFEARRQGPGEVPATGRQVFTVEAIFKQAGSRPTTSSAIDAYEANYHRPVRRPDLREDRRAASRRRTPRRCRQVVKPVPGAEARDPRRSSRRRRPRQINQILNLIYVLLFFAIVIALFGIANTLGLVDHRTHAVSSGCCARSA